MIRYSGVIDGGFGYRYIDFFVNASLKPLLHCASQGRIQVWLWGGGEFQLVELMYILSENKI